MHNPLTIFFALSALVTLLASPSCRTSKSNKSVSETNVQTPIATPALVTNAAASTWEPVKRVLDNKCIACHSCYTSPCQLDLSSYEGVMRGANKKLVYNGVRLALEKPTRLGIDAKTPEEWRAKFKFFPVVPDDKTEECILTSSIDLGMARTAIQNNYKYVVSNDQACPTPGKEWQEYKVLTPHKGMPYGLPPLNKKERDHFATWEKAGFPGPKVQSEKQLMDDMPDKVRDQIRDWEEFLNGTSVKSKIVGRYLYEHWFLAHLYFSNAEGKFFRLVRSTTPYPKDVDEIPTVRPYDDPKTATFYYRFRPFTQTVMHKNHILFPLDEALKNRLTDLFLKAAWLAEPKSVPGYDVEKASNPFVVFQDMPPRSRYQFFLDNSRYFSMTFIRGPVCEGQVAVNVIQDAFTVFFLDPSKDLSVNDPTYLKAVAPYLELPAKGESDPFESFYYLYKSRQKQYLKYRAEAYKKAGYHRTNLSHIWRGDGTNDNAVQTIFRHSDNASVIKGAWGGTPKTMWVMDYPIFERMYYLLVAGFNVFGNVFHQTSTRLYMDNLRVESEDNFLYFMPATLRESVRNYWYGGETARLKMRLENPLYNDVYLSELNSNQFNAASAASDNVERLGKLILNQKEFASVVNQRDSLNCCLFDSTLGEDPLTKQLRSLTMLRGRFSSFMPELSFLLVSDKVSNTRRFFSVSRVTNLMNVSFLLNESDRREPKDDHLAIMEQWVGGYPNLLIHLQTEQVPAFVSALKAAVDEKQTLAVLQKFATYRNDPKFWDTFDLFHTTLREKWPTEFGQLDLSKYQP
jgi:hypothetical protein